MMVLIYPHLPSCLLVVLMLCFLANSFAGRVWGVAVWCVWCVQAVCVCVGGVCTPCLCVCSVCVYVGGCARRVCVCVVYLGCVCGVCCVCGGAVSVRWECARRVCVVCECVVLCACVCCVGESVCFVVCECECCVCMPVYVVGPCVCGGVHAVCVGCVCRGGEWRCARRVLCGVWRGGSMCV